MVNSAADHRCIDFSGLPPCPYQPGFTTTIHSHLAPAPFGLEDYDGISSTSVYATDDRLRDLTRIEAVLKYPSHGSVPPVHEHRSLNMSVTKVIAGGQDCGPQVVLCTLEGKDRPSSSAVAKIYDPLYYELNEVEWPVRESLRHDWAMKTIYTNLDVMGRADEEYSREVAAYEKLRSVGTTEGSITAKYYGSWCFTLPVRCPTSEGFQERAVRMILLEHLDGSNMRQLSLDANGDPESDLYLEYHKDLRDAIMARLLHMESVVRHVGVYHRDFKPRNIILVPQLAKGPPLTAQAAIRVVLIDFGHSVVDDKAHPDSNYYSEEAKHALPVNPIINNWLRTNPYFAQWYPEVLQKMYAKREWLIERFGKDDGTVYRLVNRPLDIKWEDEGRRVPEGGWDR